MRYQAALLPAFAKGFGGQGRLGSCYAKSLRLASLSRGAAKAGGPGRIRTYNLAVMSGRLYR